MLVALITRLFTGEADIFVSRLKRQVGFYVLLAILGLALSIFLLLALFLWLAGKFGALPTALGFSGVFLVLFLVTYILAVLAKRRPVRRDDDRLQRDVASIAGVAALTNAPRIVRAMRQKRGLILLPLAGLGFYGLYRLVAAMRGR